MTTTVRILNKGPKEVDVFQEEFSCDILVKRLKIEEEVETYLYHDGCNILIKEVKSSE